MLNLHPLRKVLSTWKVLISCKESWFLLSANLCKYFIETNHVILLDWVEVRRLCQPGSQVFHRSLKQNTLNSSILSNQANVLWIKSYKQLSMFDSNFEGKPPPSNSTSLQIPLLQPWPARLQWGRSAGTKNPLFPDDEVNFSGTIRNIWLKPNFSHFGIKMNDRVLCFGPKQSSLTLLSSQIV